MALTLEVNKGEGLTFTRFMDVGAALPEFHECI